MDTVEIVAITGVILLAALCIAFRVEWAQEIVIGTVTGLLGYLGKGVATSRRPGRTPQTERRG